MKYKTLIGIEIHSQLLTETKAFCGCANVFGGDVNSHCCPVCMGMPGTLPVLNKEMIRFAVTAGLATHCKIEKHTKMDRKNYFYPDLTKGYQISQYDKPLCYEGYVPIKDAHGNMKKIRLIRIHMEEDTGKSLHDGSGESMIDYNRAGVPLIEIVSYPDMNSADEAYQYLENLKEILLFSGVSDVKMEQGSLRCDVNVNVVSESGKKSKIVELKNLNSFKAVQKAISYEEKRHIELLENGLDTEKETRRWDEVTQTTLPMRSKENVQDYRYFPEPDIVDINLTDEYIEEIRRQIPEMPADKRIRFVTEYKISEDDSAILNSSEKLSAYYENIVKLTGEPILSANFILSELLRRLKETGEEIGSEKFTPEELSYIIKITAENKINNNTAKKVFRKMFEEGINPENYIKEKGLIQVQDENLIRNIVKKVISDNPASISDIKNGKDRAFGFLVGQVMKESKGKANPQIVNLILKEEIKM